MKLLQYLEQHPDERLTAHEIAAALQKENISLSAEYRNLAQLEAEEKLHRSVKNGARESCYQYVAAKSCQGALHMSCVKCGKTFHMENRNAALFAKHLQQQENFDLDIAETVLYGTCADCKK